jgi:hypothetical protein
METGRSSMADCGPRAATKKMPIEAIEPSIVGTRCGAVEYVETATETLHPVGRRVPLKCSRAYAAKGRLRSADNGHSPTLGEGPLACLAAAHRSAVAAIVGPLANRCLVRDVVSAATCRQPSNDAAELALGG